MPLTIKLDCQTAKGNGWWFFQQEGFVRQLARSWCQSAS